MIVKSLISVLLCAMCLTACAVHVESSTAGVENSYSRALQAQVTQLQSGARPLHPACDKGGDLQQCTQASQQYSLLIAEATTALTNIAVPARVTQQNSQLIDALNSERSSFDERVVAIKLEDDRKFQYANDGIKTATENANLALEAINRKLRGGS